MTDDADTPPEDLETADGRADYVMRAGWGPGWHLEGSDPDDTKQAWRFVWDSAVRRNDPYFQFGRGRIFVGIGPVTVTHPDEEPSEQWCLSIYRAKKPYEIGSSVPDEELEDNPPESYLIFPTLEHALMVYNAIFNNPDHLTITQLTERFNAAPDDQP